MATLTTAFDTAFTPAVGSFNVQCSRGIAQLERRNTSGADWVPVGLLKQGESAIIDNPIAAADYRFVGMAGTPVVRADQ